MENLRYANNLGFPVNGKKKEARRRKQIDAEPPQNALI